MHTEDAAPPRPHKREQAQQSHFKLSNKTDSKHNFKGNTRRQRRAGRRAGSRPGPRSRGSGRHGCNAAVFSHVKSTVTALSQTPPSQRHFHSAINQSEQCPHRPWDPCRSPTGASVSSIHRAGLQRPNILPMRSGTKPTALPAVKRPLLLSQPDSSAPRPTAPCPEAWFLRLHLATVKTQGSHQTGLPRPQ